MTGLLHTRLDDFTRRRIVAIHIEVMKTRIIRFALGAFVFGALSFTAFEAHARVAQAQRDEGHHSDRGYGHTESCDQDGRTRKTVGPTLERGDSVPQRTPADCCREPKAKGRSSRFTTSGYHSEIRC